MAPRPVPELKRKQENLDNGRITMLFFSCFERFGNGPILNVCYNQGGHYVHWFSAHTTRTRSSLQAHTSRRWARTVPENGRSVKKLYFVVGSLHRLEFCSMFMIASIAQWLVRDKPTEKPAPIVMRRDTVSSVSRGKTITEAQEIKELGSILARESI